MAWGERRPGHRRVPELTRRRLLGAGAAALAAAVGLEFAADTRRWAPAPPPPPGPTGCGPGAELGTRPGPLLRLEAADQGVVLRHGGGPGRFDVYGARDAVVWRYGDAWYMHYDGAGDAGWLACRATSPDGRRWTKAGPVLGLGIPGSADAGSASYAVPVETSSGWYLFYLGAAAATAPPDRVPETPYRTLSAIGPGPAGPWIKQPQIVPFALQPGTYYADTASPGGVFAFNGQYCQYFSAAAGSPLQRTLGLARTTDLNGAWTVEPQPILPATEQIENSSVYYEAANNTWFLFTNHIGFNTIEYTQAIWVYWTSDPTSWDPARKAVVLDGRNCCWSRRVVGLPSIVALDDRLALYYDGLAGSGEADVGRDVGLAYLPRPLAPPS
jgi:predicted GH43/DUF377 family glycosyl hydrolase